MEKFLYTNSNGVKALYEAEPLTEELYSNLLIQDEVFLNKILKGQIEEFSKDSSFTEAASSILNSRNKNKNPNPQPKDKESDLIMVVLNKTNLPNQEKTEPKKKPETTKQLIRNLLPTNKIRLFKKEKMQYDV